LCRDWKATTVRDHAAIPQSLALLLYRRKYDLEQTLADFQKNLREDVDMETLKANLVGVVSETMQPASVRLWVRETK
jgi:uncharacterized protein YcbX